MATPNNTDEDKMQIPDPVILGKALIDAYDKALPILEDYVQKHGSAEAMERLKNTNFDPMNVKESYFHFLDLLAQNPEKFIQIQTEYIQDWMILWQNSLSRFMGEEIKDEYSALSYKGDRRFKAPEWQNSAMFNFIKESYLLTCDHIERAVSDTEGLNDQEKKKLKFQAKLFTDALSPTNFALTNPDVLKETMKTGGQNLVKGFENLIKDLERGQGDLSISTTNYDAFELGKNIAITSGDVIYENDLMQLIQYAPTTKQVHKTPILIAPPWINKYYILDLRPGNSFVEWLVEQGHTVFIISWVNPTPELAQKEFADYMDEGILSALDEIEKVTKEKSTNVVGYCLGGTLLATTIAYLSTKKKADRIKSATFLTTMLDFEHAGDMKLFLDDAQLAALDQMMEERGILDGKEMQRTFSLMRSNDLIWSFVVNNYLMGKEPFPFDLLYWNDDCTNMPAAMHRFYLLNMYRDNRLVKKDGITIKGTKIDLKKIKTPCHFVSTKEDHIAPWVATFPGAKMLNTDTTFTLAASGHIAGVVNPPHKNKYCYWTNDLSKAENTDEWLEGAEQHEGSWWPQWKKWLDSYNGEKVPARKVKNSIEPAPGRYVRYRNK